MSRPRADDPKVSVSLRVRASLLSAYQAGGADWRERMHAALERGLDGRETIPAGIPSPPTKPRFSFAARGKTEVVERNSTVMFSPTRAVQFGPTPRAPGTGLKKEKTK